MKICSICKFQYKLMLFLTMTFSIALAQNNPSAPFKKRLDTIINGDFTIIANNTVSLYSVLPYNNDTKNNNDIDILDSMKYVDIDGNYDINGDNRDDTFNSSNADLINPFDSEDCYKIIKAYLYWTASDKEPENPVGNQPPTNSENQPNWNYNEVLLMLPTPAGEQGEYVKITAEKSKGEVIFRARDYAEHFSNDPYTCVKDITDLVNNLESPFGTYQVANVESKVGRVSDHAMTSDGRTIDVGACGGWQIVFVYENETALKRSITLFDGYNQIVNFSGGGGNPDAEVDIEITGFSTIDNGPVNANIVFGALEGDRMLNGDVLSIKKTGTNDYIPLSTATRNSNNFFESAITINDANFIAREPASTNTLGFDAGIFALDNPGNTIIGNKQTSVDLKISSTQETFGLYLIGFSVEIFAPNLGPIKIETDVADGTEMIPGQELTNAIEFKNNGNDDAKNVTFTTKIADNLELLPITNLPEGVTYTFTSGILTFKIADNLVKINDPLVKFEYKTKVKDLCYFLTEDCSKLSFESQIEAKYTGGINDKEQTTISSSEVSLCGGNNEPSKYTIKIDKPLWETADSSLNRTVECTDLEGLEEAQKLFPVAKPSCNYDLKKTSGEFIPNTTNCTVVGEYKNTWVLTDKCGNVLNFEQIITVQDSTSPEITLCKGEIEPETVKECTGEDVDKVIEEWNNNNISKLLGCVKDDCQPELPVEIKAELGDFVAGCGKTGSVTAKYYAIDYCKNKPVGFIEAKLIIQDVTGPELSEDCKNLDLNAECSADASEAEAFNWNQDNLKKIEDCAVDLCSSVKSISSNYDFDNYEITDCGGKLEVEYTITDECDNPTVVIGTYYTGDAQPPIITCDFSNDNLVLECGDTDNTTKAENWRTQILDKIKTCVKDECTPNFVPIITDNFDTIVLGTPTGCTPEDASKHDVEFKIFDGCNNFRPLVLTIIVQDTTAPEITEGCEPKDKVFECEGTDGGLQAILDWDNENLNRLKDCVVDGCARDSKITVTSTLDISQLPPPACAGQGQKIEIVYSLSDGCNIVKYPVNIVIEDSTPPLISDDCLSTIPTVLECDGDNKEVIKQWNEKNLQILKDCATDGCALSQEITVTSNIDNVKIPTPQCPGQGIPVVVTYTVSDICGNRKDYNVTVSIEDTTPPDLNPNETLDKVINVVCSDIPDVPKLTFNDACSVDFTVEFKEESTYEGDQDTDFVITRTWTLKDNCDNTNVLVQTVNVSSTTFTSNLNGDYCIDDGLIDLNSYVDTNETVKKDWKQVSGEKQLTITDGTINPEEITDLEKELGEYKFTYTATDGKCFRETFLTLDINDNCIVWPCGPENFTLTKALTPNGDQHNQYFTVEGSRKCEFPINLKIFNRWGSIIYESDNYQNNWDGTTNKSSIGADGKVPNGTYYYVITLVGSGFEPFNGPIYIGTR